MKYYAKINTTNSFVIALYSPHDEFDLVADVVEITEESYASAISSGEKITDFKVVIDSLVLDEAENNSTIINEKIVRVKEIAGEKINSILPEWKQRNLIARSSELTEKKVDGIALTQSETDELIAIKAMWERVKAIRTASNTIENEVSLAIDPLSINIETSTTWPE